MNKCVAHVNGMWVSSTINCVLFFNARTRLSLGQPGSFENISKEIRNVLPAQFLFDGAKADLTKVLSPNFHVTHSFQMGSVAVPPSYSFGAAFGDVNGLAHGTIDSEGNLQSRFQYALSPSWMAKMQAQIGSRPGTSMLQLDAENIGSTHTINVKGLNVSPIDGTGVVVASYLQSITRCLSLGVEGVYQRPSVDIEDSAMSIGARYASGDYILSGLYQHNGSGVHASYHRKLSDKVELAAEYQLAMPMGRLEAVATAGAKYEFKQAAIRASIDTTGKVAAVIEERIAPAFAFLISGEMDHAKGQSKFGIGIMLEA